MVFICNLCGATVEAEEIARETGPCSNCGSNSRLRSLIYLLGQSLLKTEDLVSDWPTSDLKVVGVSDWPAFVGLLQPKLSYVNTQFDPDLGARDFLDITAPSNDFVGSADAVICSEVIEHVAPPVNRAFSGLFSILKPGGVLIFTVPYTLGESTVEHFPDLHDWALAEREGTRVLFNATRDGRLQEFNDLRFHGGGREVLEMRVFSRVGLIENLESAGFVDIRVMDENIERYGIVSQQTWSRPITARKPHKAPQSSLPFSRNKH